jgi:hypothetical protein
MKEVRQRFTRVQAEKRQSTVQRKLTEAVVKDAVIEEVIVADNLTSKQAYELEYRYLEQMVYEGPLSLSFEVDQTAHPAGLLVGLRPYRGPTSQFIVETELRIFRYLPLI